LNNWVSHASYRALPISVNDPTDGERALLVDPADELASPKGWHYLSSTQSSFETVGNNASAQLNPSGSPDSKKNKKPLGGPELNFDFPLDLTKPPKEYADAAVTNLFVWNNYMHDIFYHYGFDEVSGNFQNDNFGKGGLGHDSVTANAQDGSGYNNANFSTPPDGREPKMRMYIWLTATPAIDGDLDNCIIVHEYSHGISIRLTGGPANSNCLMGGEAGGMGEGWGDVFGIVLRQRETYTRQNSWAMGNYATHDNKGVRKYRYSTDMNINPSVYSFIRKSGYGGVHAKGEVWAVILWEVYWNFVDKYGFDPNVKTGKGGNNKFIQNVVDGLKLQPCNPNFVQARDAIIQADKENYQGANVCLMWKGFAKRGLGIEAKSGGYDGFNVPTECK